MALTVQCGPRGGRRRIPSPRPFVGPSGPPGFHRCQTQVFSDMQSLSIGDGGVLELLRLRRTVSLGSQRETIKTNRQAMVEEPGLRCEPRTWGVEPPEHLRRNRLLGRTDSTRLCSTETARRRGTFLLYTWPSVLTRAACAHFSPFPFEPQISCSPPRTTKNCHSPSRPRS